MSGFVGLGPYMSTVFFYVCRFSLVQSEIKKIITIYAYRAYVYDAAVA